ncbi:MAG TPA: OadG-related small transporter subunit [Syntrophales bacterium]|nr:OadG-related small transporter subunit [Syntrophales bacterium]
MVDWGKAFETFVVGFGGVFVTLIILQTGINLFSKIVVTVTNMTKKKD